MGVGFNAKISYVATVGNMKNLVRDGVEISAISWNEKAHWYSFTLWPIGKLLLALAQSKR